MNAYLADFGITFLIANEGIHPFSSSKEINLTGITVSTKLAKHHSHLCLSKIPNHPSLLSSSKGYTKDTQELYLHPNSISDPPGKVKHHSSWRFNRLCSTTVISYPNGPLKFLMLKPRLSMHILGSPLF